MDAPAADLVALLRARAAAAPAGHAYTFIAGPADERLTYGALDGRARAVAAALQERTRPGDRVLLAFPPGLGYVAAFFGCLYAGAIAVPAYPPVARRWVARVRAIADDARPALALTDAATARALRDAPEGPPLGDLPLLATDDLVAPAGWAPAAVGPADAAFLQYTSGSTAAPKGVVVRHANLLHNLGLIHAGFGHGPGSVALVWLPPYHDMGLVGGILAPMYGGFPGVLMPPAAFLRHPMAWLRAIHAHGATTSGGPDFGYDLCVQRLRPEALEGVDLAGWRVAFDGAEPVRAATLARFAAALAPWGFDPAAFTPCYGLAEATLIVSAKPPGTAPVVLRADAAALAAGRVAPAGEGADAVALVGSGRVLGGQDVRIMDPATGEACPPGVVGEVWLAGPSVAAGYWGQPDDPAFRARPADAPPAPGPADGAGPFLRTGDLGVLRDGELFVTGRAKDLLIVDGANHYPQDLEATALASHPGLRGGAAAFARAPGVDEGVAIAAEAAPGADAEGAIAAIRRAVGAEHGVGLVAVVLLRPGGLPRTSSGKVRRAACREALATGDWPVVAAWPPTPPPAPPA